MSRMAEIINRALLTKSMKVVSSVYETKDYSIFKELEDNRDITKARGFCAGKSLLGFA